MRGPSLVVPFAVFLLAVQITSCTQTSEAQSVPEGKPPQGDVSPAFAEAARIPDLVSSIRVSQPLEFCGEPVPLDVPEVRERLEKELLLSLWDRPQVILWLKRTTRYFPKIEKILKENGMPEDLKYLSVAESALRPHAGSSKGAVGFWQFMPQTGRKYGLTVNSRIDERRNLEASTRAAVGYFKGLYALFGSWTVAAAAFNAGEEGLTAEIMEQDTRNYYDLYLPLETQQFVFRILAVKLILSNPEKYGFGLLKEDYYPPEAVDRMQFQCAQDTPIRIIAQAADSRFKVIKDLNPEVRGYFLAPGTYTLSLPPGASKNFQSRFDVLLGKYLEACRERVYVVKEGDSLTSIAERFGIPIMSLLIWNRIDLKHLLHPGDRLIVFSEGSKAELVNGTTE